MGVLSFNNTSDKLTWTTLASPIANLNAHTFAVLFRRGGTGQFDALGYTLDTGDAQCGVSIANDDGLITDTGTGSRSTPGIITNTTLPYIVAVSKAAGTATPRFSWMLSGGGWTHDDGSSTEDAPTATDSLEIGVWEASFDWFNGHIGLVAFWSGAMSDTDKEALDNNWQTSDWWNSAHGQPVFLAELNVAGASVVDLAGNATGLTASGTTLDAAQTLASWNFDGTGEEEAGAPYRESYIRRSRRTTW